MAGPYLDLTFAQLLYGGFAYDAPPETREAAALATVPPGAIVRPAEVPYEGRSG